MKRLEKLLLSGCGYTVLILSLFYLFALFDSYTQAYINFPTFLLIFLFGILVSLAGMILKIDRIKMPLRLLIHYATLLITFCVVFIFTGNLSAGGGSIVFSAIVIFTFLYVILALIVYLVLKFIRKADLKMDSLVGSKKESKKNAYSPLYKSYK